MAAPQRAQVAVHVEKPESIGCLAVVVRLTWMMFGNLVLLVLAALAADAESARLIGTAYFALVAGMVALRYFDIAKLRGRTIEGEVATRAHWTRYAMGTVAFWGALWAFARFVVAKGWL